MKRLPAALALTLLCSLIAYAQSDTPKADLFAGYAYGSIDADLDRISTHGFGISLTGNLSRTLGITGEYTYGRGDVDLSFGNNFIDTDLTTHLFLAGPRLHARGERVTGFAHALFGVTKSDIDISVPGLNLDLDETNFAMGFGGGVDYNLSDKFAIRIVQADYIPVKVDGGWLHNARVMAGVVVRF